RSITASLQLQGVPAASEREVPKAPWVRGSRELLVRTSAGNHSAKGRVMDRYEFFIAGRWRNKQAILEVRDLIRAADRSYYCFIENDYSDEPVDFSGAFGS
ncbi:MAG TPA: hypothetical protein VEY30_07805, partial [Myxococcaceae bacterium]|nr:hypothetical protein [Myxococcaceae bacterium]